MLTASNLFLLLLKYDKDVYANVKKRKII